MLNYRENYCKFTKSNLAPFESTNRQAYPILVEHLKCEINIENLIEKITEIYLFIEEECLVKDSFRFNSENQSIIQFLIDVCDENFVFSDKKIT